MALKIGIQMYSVRNAFAADPVGTIRQISEMGYKYLEFANLDAQKDTGSGFGIDARFLREVISDFGCILLGSHIAPFDRENVDRVLEYHAELGSKYLISKPFNGTRDENLRAAELYNFLGEKCRAAGMQHVLHTGIPNYDEYGEWTLDLLQKYTDPENLMYELDTYWIMRSDHDIIEVIRKFGNRILFIHQKDIPKDFQGVLNISSVLPMGRSCGGYVDQNFFEYVNKEDFIEIGQGIVDHQAIIDATIRYTNASHIILEQDYTKIDEIESVRISFENLRKYQNVTID